MSEFSERLIQLRTQTKLSLTEICRGAGIPPSRLVELERGIRIPTSGQIENLENYYKVDSGNLAELATVLEKAE
jgi:transcriptional regulator with XRE-family HTH domain